MVSRVTTHLIAAVALLGWAGGAAAQPRMMAAPMPTLAIPTPGSNTTGLAWDGERFWAVDGADLWVVDPHQGGWTRRLSAPEPLGPIAWDGSGLWVVFERGDAKELVRFDTSKPQPATCSQTLFNPSVIILLRTWQKNQAEISGLFLPLRLFL